MNDRVEGATRAQKTAEQMVAFHEGKCSEWPARADETHLLNFVADMVRKSKMEDNTSSLNKTVRETYKQVTGIEPGEE